MSAALLTRHNSNTSSNTNMLCRNEESPFKQDLAQRNIYTQPPHTKKICPTKTLPIPPMEILRGHFTRYYFNIYIYSIRIYNDSRHWDSSNGIHTYYTHTYINRIGGRLIGSMAVLQTRVTKTTLVLNCCELWAGVSYILILGFL